MRVNMTCCVQDTWTAVCSMTTPRAGVTVAAANGLIYAIGGRTSNDEFSAPTTMASVECYNPETDEWTGAGTMPISRCEAGVAVL
jgi:actin-binding protein IPP